jgi:hypothetical protein
MLRLFCSALVLKTWVGAAQQRENISVVLLYGFAF